MPNQPYSPQQAHVVWLYTEPVFERLDASTWLSTTRELRQQGWDVTLVAVGPEGHQQVRGVDVLCFSRPEVYVLGQIVFHLKAAWFILKNWSTIDIILYHQMSVLWILPLRLGRLFSSRPLFVVDTRTLHMLPPDKETLRDRLRRLFYVLMDRLSNSLADGRLAITTRMAEGLNIPQSKLWGIWTSGVDYQMFAPAQATRRWPETGEPIHLVYVGLLHFERNLTTLAHAVIQANAEGMSFALTLVGNGRARDELDTIAATSSGAVRVRPPVPHANVPDILAEAHVGTLPFPDEEKFRVSSPIKLFEYLAAGLPVMATAIVCHTDVMEEEYAFWARTADQDGLIDALRAIWQARTALPSMGQKAAKASQQWTWAASASHLKEALSTGLEQIRQ